MHPSRLAALPTVCWYRPDELVTCHVLRLPCRLLQRPSVQPHWGEKLVFETGNTPGIEILFHDLEKEQATEIWQSFLDWLKGFPDEVSLNAPPMILAEPARKLWAPALPDMLPDIILPDGRPDAPPENVFWSDNKQEAGQSRAGLPVALGPGEAARKERQADARQRALHSDALLGRCRTTNGLCNDCICNWKDSTY